jgi:site-specific DNA-methyltransferase (adenine-specific)
VGDCRELLKALPDESVQCCVTSPPYWGLRDYGNTRQIGLEESPEEYVEAIVGVMREVRRALKPDGTLWLNLGDSYASRKAGGRQGNTSQRLSRANITVQECSAQRPLPVGYKPKDLIGIPWRVALALQSDGWWLRSDLIWHKPNPMPESVTDRPTRNHEYIFLLTKSERYYYDAEAIMEKGEIAAGTRAAKGSSGRGQVKNVNGRAPEYWEYTGRRNKRSVWTVTTKPCKEAHFATYPAELVMPCVMAGSRLGDVVLDPFGGTGTTGKVAIELGRRAVLMELNDEYAKIIEQRTRTTIGLPLAG